MKTLCKTLVVRATLAPMRGNVKLSRDRHVAPPRARLHRPPLPHYSDCWVFVPQHARGRTCALLNAFYAYCELKPPRLY